MHTSADNPEEQTREYDLSGAPSDTPERASDTVFATKTLRARRLLRDACCTLSSILSLSLGLQPEMQAKPVQSGFSSQAVDHVANASTRNSAANNSVEKPHRVIVIGFMGGRIRGDDFVHVEARMAKDLQQRFPRAVHAAVFANHDGHIALKTVLQLLDRDRDGSLSAEEKSAAHIIIFGHSWGASETVTLARRLNQLGIPVLLTIQVDSVQKSHQNDGAIPPNVHQAINFYQTEGLLHGRSSIAAMDPEKTTILGNYQLSYRSNPISCAGYPWYARAFMKPHIEIENDPTVWSKIEALIQTRVLEAEPPAQPAVLAPG